MNGPDEGEDLARVRRQNPTWVIVRNENGTYTARRDFWGNQQIMTLRTLAELDGLLQALNHGPTDRPRRTDGYSTAEGTWPT